MGCKGRSEFGPLAHRLYEHTTVSRLSKWLPPTSRGLLVQKGRLFDVPIGCDHHLKYVIKVPRPESFSSDIRYLASQTNPAGGLYAYTCGPHTSSTPNVPSTLLKWNSSRIVRVLHIVSL